MLPTIEIDKATPPQLHTLLIGVISFSKKGFVTMGKLLRELKDDSKFRNAVGYGIDNWEDYLRQPEIGLSTNEANRLIQIYEEFIVRLGYDEDTISNIPVKNMHYLLPLVKKMAYKEEADELIADATLLSQKDFKERLYDKKVEAGEPQRTFEYMLMRKTLETGTMDRVPNIDSDLIKKTFNLE